MSPGFSPKEKKKTTNATLGNISQDIFTRKIFRILCLITLTFRKLSSSHHIIWVQGDAAPGTHLVTALQQRRCRWDYVGEKCTVYFLTFNSVLRRCMWKPVLKFLGFLLCIFSAGDGSGTHQGSGTLKHATHWVTPMTQYRCLKCS